MSSYGAKGTRTPNNRLQRTVRYALIMEEASEAERNKASWPYDGMAGFSEDPKSTSSGRLNCCTAANLERGYQAFRGSGNLRRKFLGFRLATPSRHGQMRKMGLL
jgi:hypothetical protein